MEMEMEMEMESHQLRHRMVRTNGINMHIAEQGSGPLVLLIHGFPELWFSWRHQIKDLAHHGYHVVAPDMRGYGDTDSPLDPASYTCHHLVGDLIGLLDELGHERVLMSRGGPTFYRPRSNFQILLKYHGALAHAPHQRNPRPISRDPRVRIGGRTKKTNPDPLSTFLLPHILIERNPSSFECSTDLSHFSSDFRCSHLDLYD